FRRRAWEAVGGYPVVTGSQDADMDRLLIDHPRVCCRVEEEPLPVSEWYYIYRWGASPCHLSGVPDMQAFYDSLGVAPAVAGQFTLWPHWRQDYPALVQAARAHGQDVSDHRGAEAEEHHRQARSRPFG